MENTILKTNLGKYDYICFWDGATEPMNPGGACGIGSIIFDGNGKREFEYSHYIPMNKRNSNNVAEYLGFIRLLEWFIENKIFAKSISLFGDSNLVVQQMNGRWKMRGGLYKSFALKAKELLKEVKKNNNHIVISWIGRDYNSLADELSKRELIKNKIEFRLQPIT